MPALRIACALIATLLAGTAPAPTYAHGSVTPDADLCIIRIGFFKAHFKVYLPESHGHRDFCEDLPAIGNSVFVMEYEHDGLAEVPIEFRIIENVTGQGRFTNQEHVASIDDLDAVTVFHQPPALQPDVFTIVHTFDKPGEFVGVVKVAKPDGDGDYTAVFPFEAGYTGLGYWPWIIGGLVVLQLNYLWMSGRFARSRNRTVTPVEQLRGDQHG